jgi:transcription initiation factor TFIID subunit 5
VDDSLEAYRPELVRLLWPVFVHCVLNLASDYYPRDCEAFYQKFHARFLRGHPDDLRELSVIKLPEHLDARIAKVYRGSKYRLSITSMAFNVLLQFLEAKEAEGGSVIVALIHEHFHLVTIDRAAAGNERSLAAMLSRRGEEWDHPAEDEGIPGHNPGSANTDPNAPNVLARLVLGPLPMETELMEDVRDELAEEDAKNPPSPGLQPLSEVFEQMIKKEPNDDGPSREQVPLPPSLARDVSMEIQKVREHRDRFKIDPRSGGVAPGMSVCMYTFHNTFDRYAAPRHLLVFYFR